MGLRRNAIHGAVAFHFGVISHGSIVTDKGQDASPDKGDYGWNDANEPPGVFGVAIVNVITKDGKEDASHH